MAGVCRGASSASFQNTQSMYLTNKDKVEASDQ